MFSVGVNKLARKDESVAIKPIKSPYQTDGKQNMGPRTPILLTCTERTQRGPNTQITIARHECSAVAGRCVRRALCGCHQREHFHVVSAAHSVSVQCSLPFRMLHISFLFFAPYTSFRATQMIQLIFNDKNDKHLPILIGSEWAAIQMGFTFTQ